MYVCIVLPFLHNATHRACSVVVFRLYVAMDEESGEFLDCEGSGLYAIQSAWSVPHLYTRLCKCRMRDGSLLCVSLTSLHCHTLAVFSRHCATVLSLAVYCSNHSCEPNAAYSFPANSSELHLKALEDIAAGDEVTISYLDPGMMRQSRNVRHAELASSYLFACDCTKCLAQIDCPDDSDPDTEEDEDGDEEDVDFRCVPCD